jgi:hypothetical protein
MLGVLLGGVGSYLLTVDELRHRDEELKAMAKVAAPLKTVCPVGTIKVATQSANSEWVVRCAGRGKAKSL